MNEKERKKEMKKKRNEKRKGERKEERKEVKMRKEKKKENSATRRLEPTKIVHIRFPVQRSIHSAIDQLTQFTVLKADDLTVIGCNYMITIASALWLLE